MIIKIRKEKLFSIIFISIAIALYLCGCGYTPYSGQAFSYPPGSKPHEDNWEYSGRVIVTSRQKGSFAKKSKKIVYIVVKDRNKHKHLSDKMRFECGSIEASITWDQFEILEIILYEVGNKFEDDDYNKELLKKGPVLLVHLRYTYDYKSKEFKIEDKGRS